MIPSEQKQYWYQCQERAMAPGIADGWPKFIQAPHTPNGRLKRMDGDPVEHIQSLTAEVERLREGLLLIAGEMHQDRSCSLEAQGFGPIEIAEITAKEQLAGIAQRTLKEATDGK